MRALLLLAALSVSLSAATAAAQPLPLRYVLEPNAPASGDRYVLILALRDHNGNGAEDYFVRERSGEAVSFVIVDGATGGTLRSLSIEEGYPLTEIGDATGDGVPDYVIGAPYETRTAGSSVEVGAAYLYDGATGQRVWRALSPDPEEFGDFGMSAAPIGDADGDGYPDVLVGEPGTCYLHALSGATGAHLYSVRPFDYNLTCVGRTLISIGDLDGDGLADVASDGHVNAGPRDGRVVVVSGATGVARVLTDPPPDAVEGFGTAVALAGDFDGDGAADLLTRAYIDHPDAPGERVGRVYAVSGATGAVLRTFEAPAADVVADSVRWLGIAMAGGADLDGDGVPDVAATALRSAPAFSRTYLFSGATGAVLGTAESPSPGPYGGFGSQLALLAGWGGRLVVESYDETVDGIENVGRVYVYGVGSVAAEALPDAERVALAVAPNPTAGATTLAVSLAAPTAVRLDVLDVLGRTVATLLDGPLGAGTHTARLDGASLAPGVYAVRLTADGRTATRTLVVGR